MRASPQEVSKRYGLAQTILLFAFAAVFFLSPGSLLFVWSPAPAVGSFLCAVGIVLIVLAFLSLRGTIQIAPEPRPGRQLVQQGVYKFLRHPIYTGIIFCVLGLWLKTPGAWVALAGVIVIFFLVMKVRVEEELLRAVYPEYSEYRARTWGLFPGVRSWS